VEILGARHCRSFELQAIAIEDLRWEGRADVLLLPGKSVALDKPPSQETERNLNLGQYAMR
jgi:hypothetical protein